ncbi:MAG: anaerobic ribonucleoside-triphosphate reductase activating protein [Mogibacterium sp.]|nr:anaerobic ribonucleoside-triphosphate reductase activating protein [Mogibacterium sp.]
MSNKTQSEPQNEPQNEQYTEQTGNQTIIRVCGVEPESIVDGPGFRYVLFVQGCPHRCHGCHNPESWDRDGGMEMTVGEVFAEIMENTHLRGVTFSGGEPFEQVSALLELGKMIKSAGLSLMSYSGYTLEELEARHDDATDELLGLLDILVDGRFIEAQRNLTLIYRGSENQRVIDMNRSRAEGKTVLYHSDFDEEIII